MKQLISIFIFCCPFIAFSQILQPGFDKNEYRELMLISARTTADTGYYKGFPDPATFNMIYQSKPMGLDNLWDFWKNGQDVAVISIRGTTGKAESWLANFYAAMVPAKGELRLDSEDTFTYELAVNPKAAVHVGWLLSMAYLSKEIIPQINEQYQKGTKDFLIIGHSQGGAISFLLTAYLYSLQRQNLLPVDIRFKTYCSAAPKPGNLYFGYEYEAITQGGWAFNVVNAADWVPETPISIQTLNDFNNVNPFTNASTLINKQKFPDKMVLKHIYNQLDKPTKRAQQKYEQYMGNMTSKIIKQHIKGYIPPEYYSSNHYVRTGTTIVLLPDDEYFKTYPDDPSRLFPHHFHAAYLALLDKLPEQKILHETGGLIYTSPAAELARVKENMKKIPAKKVFAHTQFGLQVPDLSALNADLSDNNYLPLSSAYFSRGGGLYTIFPKTRLAVLFNYATYSGSKTSGNRTNELRGTTVGSSIGFVVTHSEKLQLIPYAGGVYSWWGVRLSANNGTGQFFNDYLAASGDQHHLATKGWVWNFGIHVATQPFANKIFGKDIMLGLRSGYSLPAAKATKWNTNGVSLEDGPAINAQGFYAHLILGVAL